MRVRALGVSFVSILLASAFAIGVASRAHAQIPLEPLDPPESLETPRGIAMGTGARASAVSTNALAYNTANMPLAPLYHIDGFAGYEPNVGRWIVGASVVDSITSRLAMGFSFRGIISNGSEGYSGMDGKLGAAIALNDMIGIGLAGRLMQFEHEGPRYRLLGTGEIRARHFTMDGAVRVTPTPGLNIAALAYNFIESYSPLVPILVGGSASYTTAGFTVGIDALTDVSTFEKAQVTTGGGAEYLVAGQVPIRVGYKLDTGRKTHSISGGVGFVSQQFGADFGLQQVVKGGNATEFLVSLRYFVQ